MPRTGPRPHCWKIQGAENHEQYLAFLQMRAQANFRKEKFELAFEDFQAAWQGKWMFKGRRRGDYCLTRLNQESAWTKDNVQCILREQHLSNQQKLKKIKKEKAKWETQQGV